MICACVDRVKSTNIVMASSHKVNFVWTIVTAIIFTILSFGAMANVTLASKFGSLVVEGELIEFDGQFYTIQTEDGILTLRERDVTCQGIDCPVLSGFSQNFSIIPGHQIDKRTLLKLLKEFSAQNAFRFILGGNPTNPSHVDISDPAGSKLAKISFQKSDDNLVFSAGGDADVFADVIVQVLSTAGEVRQGLSIEEVLGLWTGDISDWSELGALAGPIRVIAPAFNREVIAVLSQFGDAAQYGAHIEFLLSGAQIIDAIENDPRAIAILPLATVDPLAVPLIHCGGQIGYAQNTDDYPLRASLGFATEMDRPPALLDRFVSFLRAKADAGDLRVFGLVQSIPTSTSCN